MVPGFKRRLLEELKNEAATNPIYEKLSKLADKFNILDSVNPPNIITFIGGSLLGCLNAEIERFVISKKEFEELGRVPD